MPHVTCHTRQARGQQLWERLDRAETASGGSLEVLREQVEEQGKRVGGVRHHSLNLLHPQPLMR